MDNYARLSMRIEKRLGQAKRGIEEKDLKFHFGGRSPMTSRYGFGLHA